MMTRIYYPDQPHNVPIKKDAQGNRYKNVHEYSYTDDKIHLMVKKDFKYDGASVPRLAWTLSGLRPDGLLRAAALVHDCIYLSDGLKGKYDGYYYSPIKTLKINRKEADKIFFNIMVESGVKRWRANMAYYAVRIGGRFLRNF